MKLPTTDQRAAVLDSVRAGIPIDRAARAAGTSTDALRAAARDDDDFADALESAEATGGAARARATAPTQAPSPRERPRKADEGYNPDAWARVRAEAHALAPGRLGSLLWIDARCQAASPHMHALDTWWVESFADFYASGKTVYTVRKGLRAGGSDSVSRALLRVSLFAERTLDSGTIGVVPIMSSSRDEANGRFVTIRQMLKACGVTPSRESEDDDPSEVAEGGIGGEYRSTRSQSGGGVIQTRDSQNHRIEFRILPAIRRAAVGYTGIAVFLDETDLWPDDPEMRVNPAREVIDLALKRCTTQPTAEVFISSAPYHLVSAHSARVDMGDTELQYLARLGERGAAIDTLARRTLESRIKSGDVRMTEAADPRSPNVPAWVVNPISPIDVCHKFSTSLDQLLGIYGGRPNSAKGGGASVDPFAGIAEANARLCAVPADGSRLDSRGRVVSGLGMGGGNFGNGRMM